MNFDDPSNEGFIEYGHLDDNIEFDQGDYNLSYELDDSIEAKLESLDDEVEHTINQDAQELASYEQHDTVSDLKDALFDSEDGYDNSHHDDDDIDM